MKRVFVNLVIARIYYVVLLALNIIVNVSGVFPNKNVLQYAVVVVLGYGLLCQHGYFRKEVKCERGVTEYEQSVPTLAWGVLRLLQWIFYYMFRIKDVTMGRFWFLVVLEAGFVAFLLYDKSKYYYESREIKDGAKKD